MKTYFIVADCHSFFTAMMDALIKKGFNINNSEHILISCGDMFDRGEESREMLDFLYNLYKQNRLIAIRGNHDDLFNEMMSRVYAYSHDVSNGTVKTLLAIQNKPTDISDRYFFYAPLDEFKNYDKRFDELNNSMTDYYEKGNYIFVHGWIPTTQTENKIYNYNPEWRDATKKEWESARWINGMEAWHYGVKEKNKIIVCGHWHCSWGWSHLKQERKEFPEKNRENWEKSFEPFIDKGIIALDGCTAYSGIVNVLKLTEEQFYEKENSSN